MNRSRSTHRRRALAAFAAVSMLALFVVPGVAHASVNERSFSARDIVVQTPNAGRWFMDIEAFKSGSGAEAYTDIQLFLHKENDPDGAGPLSRQEEHSWSFLLGPNALDVNGTLSEGFLRTGEDGMGAFGRLNLTFERVPGSAATTVAGCSAANQTRPVLVNGSMNFKTGEPTWGTIDRIPTRGRVGKGDGTCYDEPCPPRGFGLTGNASSGGGGLFIRIVERQGAPHADISFTFVEHVGDTSIFHELSNSVPEHRVTIDTDLGHAAIEGKASLGISGSAIFDSVSEPYTGSPYGCGAGREAVQRQRFGSMGGDLEAHMATGDVEMAPEMSANASKTIVRAA